MTAAPDVFAPAAARPSAWPDLPGLPSPSVLPALPDLPDLLWPSDSLITAALMPIDPKRADASKPNGPCTKEAEMFSAPRLRV